MDFDEDPAVAVTSTDDVAARSAVHFVMDHFDELYADSLERLLDGDRNVFLTGSQGTGKTTLTVRIIERMYRKGEAMICAGSTGAAVQNLMAVAREEMAAAVDDGAMSANLRDILLPATIHKVMGFGCKEVKWHKELEVADATRMEKTSEFMSRYSKKWSKAKKRFLASAPRQRQHWEQRRKRRRLLRQQLLKQPVSNEQQHQQGQKPTPSSRPLPLLTRRPPEQREGDKSLELALECDLPAFLFASRVLVDEISMLSAFLIDLFDQVARWWTGNTDGPFGDAFSLLYIGDFQQMPPISNDYLFKHPKWKLPTFVGGYVDVVLYLEVNIRQREDFRYAKMLERMARNAMKSEDETLFREAVIAGGPTAMRDPLSLPGVLRVFNKRDECKTFSKKVLEQAVAEGVSEIRLESASRWPMSKKKVQAIYGVDKVRSTWEKHVQEVNKEVCFEFFDGCPVFLRRNLDVSRGLVNGSRGVLVSQDEHGNPIVDFEGAVGEFLVERISAEVYLDDYSQRERAAIESGYMEEQVGRPLVKAEYLVHPLSTGLATTPWGTQGKTLTAVAYEPPVTDDSWVPSQAIYVVSSRVQTLGGHESSRRVCTRAASVELSSAAAAMSVTEQEKRERGEMNLSPETAASSDYFLGDRQFRGLFLSRFAPLSTYVDPAVVGYLKELREKKKNNSVIISLEDDYVRHHRHRRHRRRHRSKGEDDECNPATSSVRKHHKRQ